MQRSGKIRQVEDTKGSASDELALTDMQKENEELWRHVCAARCRVRNLQEDIVTVQAGTQRKMDEATRDFNKAVAAITAEGQAVEARNLDAEDRVVKASNAVEAAAARLEDARALREGAESRVRELERAMVDVQNRLSEAADELSEIRTQEVCIAAEIKSLENAKQNGVSNLEQVRVRNATEAQELEVEEQQLAQSSARLQQLREKIERLKSSRASRASNH